jgi:putative transposase
MGRRRMLCASVHKGPGHRALRVGRQSVEGEWYAITTSGRGLDLRLAGSVVIEQARRLEAEGLVALYTIVVMPDHCHLVFELKGSATLGRVIQLLKGRSARAANVSLARRGSVWCAGYHERLLRCADEAYAAWWYVLNNPVRRGLVERWEDYPFTYTIPYPEERVTPFTTRPW